MSIFLSIAVLGYSKQTCTAQPSRMSHFDELPDVVGGYLTKILRKCQKSPFPGAKCTNLVALKSGFSQIYQVCIFCIKKWLFLAFSQKFLSNIHQPHLVARQNVTFWRVGQCMSGGAGAENTPTSNLKARGG